MFELGSHPQNKAASNPFRPEASETPESQYWRTVNALARRFMYDEQDLDVAKIERQVQTALRIQRLLPLESENHGLELLLHLLKGIAAHERANEYHEGSWQAALVRQAQQRAGTQPKPVEQLTREEVAQAFDASEFKQLLVDSEQEAINHYRRLLGLSAESIVQLSQNISIHRTDIEVLINDIQARIFERIPDTERRRAALAALDRDLAGIIDRIPLDQQGKRFEIEEIYLLRRLIHATDTGHLVTVSHGTPREDLRVDRGSVDVKIIAAGDVIPLQLKTFRYGVSRSARDLQAQVHERAQHRLQGAATHLVVLEAEAVQETYEAALRQPKGHVTSLADKYATLKPIIDDLAPEERERLLTLVGLTEEKLAHEQAEYDRKYAERQQQEETMRQRRIEEAQRLAEFEARQESERRAAESAERAERDRLAALEKQQADIAAESRQRISAAAQAAEEKRLAVQARMTEGLEQAARRQEEEQRLAAEEAKREARRKKREEKKREAPDWPPKTLAGLGTAPLLMKLGFLPADWKNDARSLLNAKKLFIQLFAKPKSGSSERLETDKPNELFRQAFPSKASIISPTQTDIERWEQLGIKQNGLLKAA